MRYPAGITVETATATSVPHRPKPQQPPCQDQYPDEGWVVTGCSGAVSAGPGRNSYSQKLVFSDYRRFGTVGM